MVILMSKDEQIQRLMTIWRELAINHYRQKYYIDQEQKLREEKESLIDEMDYSTYLQARANYEALREEKERGKNND